MNESDFTCFMLTPGEGTGDPLQYPCLENPMGGGAWWAAVHGVMKSRPGTGAWWAAVYGVTQSRTQLT